jgi:uncharacterized protein (TIGR02452 family)
VSLAGIAKSNTEIFERGSYVAPSGRVVELAEVLAATVGSTRLYWPSELATMLGHGAGGDSRAEAPKIEVVEAKTGEAGRALAAEVAGQVAVLNFASARNPGGGYIGGARAQEEDLARCSALHPTLLTQREYYEVNRACDSLIYTDHIIFSPDVPFFRDERYELLDEPSLLSVITAPAPNAGEVLLRDRAAGPQIEQALRHRAGLVLAVAEDQAVRDLVLGAWGCGVFRNDPEIVADAFGVWLEGPRFRGSFERVVFAVYDRTRGQRTLGAFRARLG